MPQLEELRRVGRDKGVEGCVVVTSGAGVGQAWVQVLCYLGKSLNFNLLICKIGIIVRIQ